MDEAENADVLVAAVKELTAEVKSLRRLLVTEYPKRAEMRAVMRRRGLIYGAAIMMILAATQLMTMTTISHCFLVANATQPVGCNLIPGYQDAIDQGGRRLQRFNEMNSEIESNRVKMAELELEIEKLKADRETGK